MNKSLIIGGVVVLVILVGGYFMYSSNISNPEINSTQNNSTQNTAKGTLYFSITDAAVDMKTVSKVDMTIDKVYIHSASQGWVTVSETPQTFSLLDLKASGKSKLIAKTNINADTYDQIWFHTTSVAITESGKVKTAILPSNDFKMNTTIKVMGNVDSTAVVDVLADQSIHKTSKGEFIFAPVVNFESRSNTVVSVDSNNLLDISSGTVDSNTTAGMDINGEVKTNFKLNPNIELEVKASTDVNTNVNGLINIKGK